MEKKLQAFSVRVLFAAGRFAVAVCCTELLALYFSLTASAAHDRVRYALVGEPTSLDPLFSSGYWFEPVSELAFEPLLRLGPNNALLPALATVEPSVKNGGISADGRALTIHLRRGTFGRMGRP